MSQISVNHLTFYYEGSYDNIFEDVSFQIDTNWKLGFIARNGKGKTTFLKLLMGQYEYKGSISASVVFAFASSMSISRLCVLIWNCSRESLYLCVALRMVTTSFSVGSGIGPEIFAPVRFAVSTILDAD